MTQQLECYNDWTNITDEGGRVDVALLDISKAYDTVPHKRLLSKLKSFGFGCKLLRWIESFLTARMQRVTIESETSTWTLVGSGVPQGSVLGPTLFLCYINDLPHTIRSHIKLFADDTKVYRRIEDVSDCQDLQKDLYSLNNWSQQWKLP